MNITMMIRIFPDVPSTPVMPRLNPTVLKAEKHSNMASVSVSPGSEIFRMKMAAERIIIESEIVANDL